ncbi:tRNA 2'-phosphotransferase 1-like isoform X3 [Acanthaster planci]|uniref:2'-phosphotransferase n=1 Tax=Acanthaster planci TaxID=133434 RepID=A0A8B7XQS4_ACAPL|nr:tRNA 2'-phosphotransferase 1-like isoform X3 [Acanthaster planci]
MSRSERSRDVHLSKKLTFVLRHKAVELGFDIDSGGFINVDDLLAHPMFSHFTVGDIKRVVTSNDKQRFSLKEHPDSKKLQICANQGHSFQLPDLELVSITDPTQYPTVIHGTYLKNWDSIKLQGLSRMKRTHVHFAQGEPGENGVISGGLSFFLSKNGVILCPGDENGLIHPRYFKQVMQTHPRELLSCT